MDFALILLVLCLVTGVLWVADHFHFRKLRAPGAPDPVWVEWGAGFFPVILAVFFLRSFIVEPFKIPSGSMMPTLVAGDFILVNKYAYGIRLPVLNKKVIEVGQLQRGDVIVFRYPPNPTIDYIKRVVGLPGDKVVYRDKRLTINGVEVPIQQQADFMKGGLALVPRYSEQLGTVKHDILIEPEMSSYVQPIVRFPYLNNCQYNTDGVTCVVPPGHYFAMGDNRDNSQDSRYWGFVPDENIVGKAFFVWFNSSFDFSRWGKFN
ncbi:MAG TPA: signal peptidase I [Rhodocyclaceae bacterium]|jgi:signal peptidase I|nr:signal peptidase I [Rhodocyclaceae bacterium]